jgi:glycosyltransferase involved in cell wall biosynthesis
MKWPRSWFLAPLALTPPQTKLLALPRFDESEEPAEAFSPERPLRLLSVGRLATIKGHETIAEALRVLAASRKEGASPSFVWSVAGPPAASASDLPPSLRDLEREPWFRLLGPTR